MIVKTASGNVRICKRSPFGKFLVAYMKQHAFTGCQTLLAAWDMCKELKVMFPSMSWSDAGKLTAMNFIAKPHDLYLERITGKKKPRY